MVNPVPTEFHITLSRRTLLRAAVGFLGLALAGCEGNTATTSQTPVQEAVPTVRPAATVVSEAELTRLSNIQRMVEAGKAMRTPADIKMINETQPGIDLTYSGNATVSAIRAVQDPTERICRAIGFLNVTESQRYNGNKYVCNIYTLDLLRLLLNNDVIGSRYNKANGTPMSLGPKNINWSSKSEVDRANQQYPFLHSNNLDWWLKKYGVRLGWSQVTSKADLQKLGPGNIQLGVTKQELIDSKQIEIGHAFVLANDGSSFILTQATSNILAKPFPYTEANPKSDPTGPYSFWTHAL